MNSEGKCWDNKENRILNIKKENENKKEKQKTEIPNIKRFQELLNGSSVRKAIPNPILLSGNRRFIIRIINAFHNYSKFY